MCDSITMFRAALFIYCRKYMWKKTKVNIHNTFEVWFIALMFIFYHKHLWVSINQCFRLKKLISPRKILYWAYRWILLIKDGFSLDSAPVGCSRLNLTPVLDSNSIIRHTQEHSTRKVYSFMQEYKNEIDLRRTGIVFILL